MTTNEDRKNSATSNNTDSLHKDRDKNAKSDNNKGNGSNNDNNASILIDGLSSSHRIKQKKREVEQLAINPDDILEELEKRQPLCQEGE